MKNCGVIYARFKQQSEARRAVNNETPERRAVKWVGWIFWPGVRQTKGLLARGPKETGLSLGRRLLWIPSDQKAPDHGTIQKRNLTSRAHPAKLASSKNLQQRGLQSGMQSLKEMVAATSSHRCQRTLLSLARLPGVNRQGGLPKKLIGTSSRIRTTIKFVTRLPGAQYSSSSSAVLLALFSKFLNAETKSPQRRAKASINRRRGKREANRLL